MYNVWIYISLCKGDIMDILLIYVWEERLLKGLNNFIFVFLQLGIL